MIEDPNLFTAERDIFLVARRFPGMTVERAKAARLFTNRDSNSISRFDLIEFLDEASEWDYDGALGEEPDFSLRSDDDIHRSLDFVANWLSSADAYHDHLNEIAKNDPASYEQLYVNEVKAFENEQLEERRRYDVLQPFSEPEANARYSHWLRMTGWKPSEAVALSLGKEPKKVTPELLAKYAGRSWLADEYFDRLEILERAIESGEDRLGPLTAPANFIAWATSNDWDLPDDLAIRTGMGRAALEVQVASLIHELEIAKKTIARLEYQLAAPEDENAKRLATLDKLLIGMARANWFAQGKFKYTQIAKSSDQYPPVRVAYDATQRAIDNAMGRLEIQVADLE